MFSMQYYFIPALDLAYNSLTIEITRNKDGQYYIKHDSCFQKTWADVPILSSLHFKFFVTRKN